MPKEDNWYLGHTTDTNEVVRLRNVQHSDWLFIDWYLQPYEIQLPNDEEMKELCKQELPVRISSWIQGFKCAIAEILRRNEEI